MAIEADGTALDMSSKGVQDSLAFLRDHTEVLGGEVKTHSPATASRGTRIEVLMPLREPEETSTAGTAG
jgi:glucose-6-phosphate-specific signal transduction histidine kinase